MLNTSNANFWATVIVVGVQLFAWLRWPAWRRWIAAAFVLSGLDSLNTLFTSNETPTFHFVGSQVFWIAVGVAAGIWWWQHRPTTDTYRWWSSPASYGRWELAALTNYGDVHRRHQVADGRCTAFTATAGPDPNVALCRIVFDANVTTTVTTTKGTHQYGPYARTGLVVHTVFPVETTVAELETTVSAILVGCNNVTGTIDGVHRGTDAYDLRFVADDGTVATFTRNIPAT